MAGRRLSPEEATLWQRVMATVNPIDPGRVPDLVPPRPPASGVPQPIIPVAKAVAVSPVGTASKKATLGPGATLDGSWDRRLSSGAVIPDCTIDLHGHTLETAYKALDQGLSQAIRRGDRVLLLVTGKPPRAESERPHARGRIRAAVNDWLTASRHAADIAAVRGAHPRHGGAGALYLILRRPRP